MKLPADLPGIVVTVDTREPNPHPWKFRFPAVVKTLHVGDFSVAGLENQIAAERKTLADFVACCGAERERFERMLDAMRGWPNRCVIIEASWADLERGGWKSKITPKAVVASALAFMRDGHPVILAGDAKRAADLCERFLYLSARSHWRTARELISAANLDETPANRPAKRTPNAKWPEGVGSFIPE